jgi:hypothetical protein
LPPVDERTNGVAVLKKRYELTEIVRQAKDSYVKVIANSLKESIKSKNYIALDKIFSRAKYPLLKLFYDERAFLEDFTKNSQWYKCKNIALSYANSDVDRQNSILRYKYWLLSNIEVSDYIRENDVLVFNEPYANKFQNSETVVIKEAVKKYDKYIKIEYWECKDKENRSFYVVDKDSEIKYNEYLTKVAKEARTISKEKKEERKKKWAHYFAVKNKYANVKYIFASTIHKSQGSTYENVYINVGSIVGLFKKDIDLAYRLLYVAVTRASKDIRVLF